MLKKREPKKVGLLRRILIVSIAAICGLLFVLATPVRATTVWIGELDDCQRYYLCRNLSSGDTVNIDLYEGWLGGIDPGSRCDHYGGGLAFNRRLGWVCLNADF